MVGLTNSAAIELGEYNIRVNSIHPWGAATAMAEDPNVATVLTAHPTYVMSFGMVLTSHFPAHLDDISDAITNLASDLSRAVTATQLTVDMGATKVYARRRVIAAAIVMWPSKPRDVAMLQ